LSKPSIYVSVDDAPFPFTFSANNANFPLGDNVWDYVLTDPTAEDTKTNTDGCPGTGFKVSPAGKVAIIRFGTIGGVGTCGSGARCNAAAAAGAIACITYAADDLTSLYIGGSRAIPSASITNAAGVAIVNAFKANKPAKVVFNPEKQAMFPIVTGGTVSDFSSPGLDPELWIKPDLGGVGGEVLSTVSPAAVSGTTPLYDLSSGTSMAAPYVAGVIALLIEANPKITFAEVKSRLVNHAQPAKLYGTDLTDSVAKQGGGLVNAFNSVASKTVVYPSSFSLNDTTRTQQHYTMKITNSYTVPVTYTLAHEPAAQMNVFAAGDDLMQEKATLEYTPDYAQVTFRNMRTRSFRVKAGETAEARVDIEPPVNARKDLWPVYSGYVTLTNDQDDIVIRVPYAGVAGDWDEAPIFSRNSPSLFASMSQNAVFNAAGFVGNATQTVAAGTYLLDGSFTPFLPLNDTTSPLPARVQYTISAADGLLVNLPFSTTTRGFRVEVEYVGTNRTIRNQIRDLGGQNKGDGKAYMVLDAPEIVYDASTENVSLANVGPLQAANVQRSAPNEGQSVLPPSLYLWSGKVFMNEDAEESVDLPLGGEYVVKLSGMKHFKRVGGRESQYDVIRSGIFRWVAAPANAEASRKIHL
jgi:hypothetical protein